MTDFLRRFDLLPDSERSRIRVARLLTFGIGIAIVCGSALMRSVPGNLMAVTSKTSTLLTPIVFCLFFFALFVPFARPAGVWCGAIAGTVTAVLIAFSGPLFGQDPKVDPISFQWIAPATVVVDLAVGLFVCGLQVRT
jgi:SSS family solute:Na+ symporter